MPPLPHLILGVTPAQEADASATSPFTLAHMAYRLAPGPQLLRYRPTPPGAHGLLYCAGREVLQGPFSSLAQALAEECGRQHYRGVIADLPPGSDAAAAALARALARQGYEVYLPEHCHAAAPEAKMLVSTALSGGWLDRHLEQALGRYGPQRTVAALERAAEDFPLPAPSGRGEPLSRQAARQLLRRQRRRSFWSEALCTHCFFYLRDGQPRLVLYDDADSLGAKLRCARDLGIREAFVVWEELGASSPMK